MSLVRSLLIAEFLSDLVVRIAKRKAKSQN